MANTSVSGLVSGLDTAAIIGQLMQIEAQPQTNLKNRVSTEQKVVTALQAINTKLAGITTKAGDLAKLTNWSPMTATSDNAKVTVSASSTAGSATLGFTVGSPAAAFRAQYAATGSDSAAGTVTANTQYAVTFDDPTRPSFTFSSGDGSLKSVAAALNASGSGVDATLVPVGGASGSFTYALVVQDERTGKTASGFKITPASNLADTTSFAGGAPSPSAGTDASITLTGSGTTLTSSTNTFKDLMPGVDVTLAPDAAGSANITVARDTKTVSDSVKAMVDAVNSVLSDIDTQTAYDAATKKSGPLAGDSLLRGLRDQLVSAITSGQNNKSFADVGIQVDRYGKVVFDEAKFQAAYAKDPNATAAMFTDDTSGSTPAHPGLASTLASITKVASNSTIGTVTLAIKGRNDGIKRMNDDIADWDVRLQVKQQSLQRQYAALEVALGKLQDQASWLSGQISSLPKMSS